MITNQTIDGVPSECKECGGTSLTWFAQSENKSGVQEGRLRTHEVSSVFVLGCDDCSETLRVVSADKMAALLNKPAAQPQGGPVVCRHEWTDDGEFLLVCTACGAQEDYNQALQRAFELGGTDDGSYHLEADELCEVIRLHTEQPAPLPSIKDLGGEA